MCVDNDSRPPIPPIAGGSAGSRDLRLSSADGMRFMAHAARAGKPTGAGMVVIPDVRGLHPYYKELADRFAEVGVDAVAIDFFARTAPSDDRSDSFDFMSHVPQTKPDALQADIAAAVAYLRGKDGGEVRSVFSVGFCFGGALSYLQAASGLGYAGVIGFYGWPLGLSPQSGSSHVILHELPPKPSPEYARNTYPRPA
jgi:carboxymethylenebutenolidase